MVYEGMKDDKVSKYLQEPGFVAVTVGPESNSTTWHLQKKLLTSSSPFFTAALSGNFKEGKLGEIVLPEDHPDVVKLFVTWLYVGNEEICVLNPNTLMRAWAFGDKIECPAFQDCFMLSLMKYMHDDNDLAMTIDRFRFAYKISAAESKLRQYFTDYVLFAAHNGGLEDDGKGYLSLAKETEDVAHDFLKSCLSESGVYYVYPRLYQRKYLLQENESLPGWAVMEEEDE